MNLRGDGMRSWLIQRVSAVVIALFIIYLVLSLWSLQQLDYSGWHSWVAEPQHRVILLLSFLALFMHAWVGIRDVVLDYVHHVGLRFLLLTAIIGVLLAMAMWLLLIIIGV